MALNLVRACDRFQLLLFAPMLLFGLRAAEPCYLFREYLEIDWFISARRPICSLVREEAPCSGTGTAWESVCGTCDVPRKLGTRADGEPHRTVRPVNIRALNNGEPVGDLHRPEGRPCPDAGVQYRPEFV